MEQRPRPLPSPVSPEMPVLDGLGRRPRLTLSMDLRLRTPVVVAPAIVTPAVVANDEQHALSCIGALLQSWRDWKRQRSQVLELQIGTYITRILDSREARHAVERLQAKEARAFLDSIQHVWILFSLHLRILTIHQ